MIHCNINSVQVDLKQWLYKNGEEFPWNTGGWMKCKVGTVNTQHYASVNQALSPSGTVIADVTMTNTDLRFKGSASATCGYTNNQGYGDNYSRSTIWSYMNAGTQKPLSNLKAYKQLKTSATSIPIASIRTGNKNDSNTLLSTPTVVVSGNTPLTLNIMADSGYLVVGKNIGANGYGVSSANGRISTNPGNFSALFEAVITEIWLE